MGLVPPPGKIVNGSILFEGTDLLQLTEGEMRGVRGNRISMIFQEPMTSLSSMYTIGNQIMENILLHSNMSKQEARALTIKLLSEVGIPKPERLVNESLPPLRRDAPARHDRDGARLQSHPVDRRPRLWTSRPRPTFWI